jgi:hypothetical protein
MTLSPASLTLPSDSAATQRTRAAATEGYWAKLCVFTDGFRKLVFSHRFEGDEYIVMKVPLTMLPVAPGAAERGEGAEGPGGSGKSDEPVYVERGGGWST